MTETFTITIPVRYRDLDTLGHVNNAVYATYLETARVEYFSTMYDDRSIMNQIVVASLSIDFRRPITDIGEITVDVETVEIGRTSLELSYVVSTADETAATAETTIVILDEDTGKPTPVSEAIRNRIQEFHDENGPSAEKTE